MLRLFAVLAVAIAGAAVASSVSAYTPNPEDSYFRKTALSCIGCPVLPEHGVKFGEMAAKFAGWRLIDTVSPRLQGSPGCDVCKPRAKIGLIPRKLAKAAR